MYMKILPSKREANERSPNKGIWARRLKGAKELSSVTEVSNFRDNFRLLEARLVGRKYFRFMLPRYSFFPFPFPHFKS